MTLIAKVNSTLVSENMEVSVTNIRGEFSCTNVAKFLIYLYCFVHIGQRLLNGGILLWLHTNILHLVTESQYKAHLIPDFLLKLLAEI